MIEVFALDVGVELTFTLTSTSASGTELLDLSGADLIELHVEENERSPFELVATGIPGECKYTQQPGDFPIAVSKAAVRVKMDPTHEYSSKAFLIQSFTLYGPPPTS